MTAFYAITRLLTFPGLYVRCFWEQVVCRIFKIPVEDNRYLRSGEECGHIEHEFMPTANSAFAFCFIPAFMNAIGAFFLSLFPLAILFIYETETLILVIVTVISYWFACSLYVNSYSMIEDAVNMMDKIYKDGNALQKIIYAPGALCLYIGSYFERYGVTFIISAVATVALVLI